MDFDYDALSVLSAVVRGGSFEAAAKAMNVTQSAVSQRIKQLEQKFGAILILRGRPCVPTEEGLLLCRHLEEVQLLEHGLRERLHLDDREGGGLQATVSVRISVNSDSLATWFPEVVARAANELHLRLEVIPEDQEFTEERLRSGDALAIVTSSPNTVPGCQSIELGVMEYMAVASPDFVGRHIGGKPTLKRIARAPSIQFDRKDTLPIQWVEKAFGGVERLSSHQMPSYEGHLQCCLQSIGWAMMPTLTVGPLVEKGVLVELIPGVRLAMPLYWQCRANASGTLQKLNEVVTGVAGAALIQDPPVPVGKTA
jgi:LysR family transcriptional regulator (chromosome initiation inhibitor)